MKSSLRQAAEVRDQVELNHLKAEDTALKPENWFLSPKMALLYILGGVSPAGNRIRTKYFGESGLVESAIASLATDRALLLLGVPGTGKSWLSEHLAAAISGCSTLLVQCTVGTDEQQLRYGWNYAQLLAKGPSQDALVETPLMRAMKAGQLLRLEELTRMNSEMQDQLITILSEKVLPIPELNELLYAQRGFNVIATSNTKDRGVNLMSSALKRRFNTVVLPLPDSIEKEQEIVQTRVAELGQRLKLPPLPPLEEQLQQILTIFRELRRGESEDGTRKLKSPSGTLSTAEIIDLVVSSWSHAAYFGKGRIDARSLAPNIISTILKDPQKDRVVLLEYLEGVLRERPDFSPLYQSIKDVV